MIINATFTSVWDDDVVIETSCLVDTVSQRIFDIKTVDAPDVEILIEEYVTIDGIKYPACSEEFRKENPDSYWYE